ncbi:MAG: cold shock domain-containing protein [Pseudolabrys sp.]
MTNDDELQHGTVTFWKDRSYGFIRPDAPSPNRFFHVTELNGQRVKHGDRVSFQTAPDKRNPAKFCAVAVQVGSGGIK